MQLFPNCTACSPLLINYIASQLLGMVQSITRCVPRENTLLFKLKETRSVETKFLKGTPICKYVTHSLTHSLTHSGVDTLRN